MKANTTIAKIAHSIRRFFVGEAYTVAACLLGYGTFTCTIKAPNRQRVKHTFARRYHTTPAFVDITAVEVIEK